jgi:uncharacterized membrane protein
MSSFKDDSKTKSIYKTFSWRVIASTITASLAFIATGSIKKSTAIFAADFLIKLVVYYYHERAWKSFE